MWLCITMYLCSCTRYTDQGGSTAYYIINRWAGEHHVYVRGHCGTQMSVCTTVFMLHDARVALQGLATPALSFLAKSKLGLFTTHLVIAVAVKATGLCSFAAVLRVCVWPLQFCKVLKQQVASSTCVHKRATMTSCTLVALQGWHCAHGELVRTQGDMASAHRCMCAHKARQDTSCPLAA